MFFAQRPTATGLNVLLTGLLCVGLLLYAVALFRHISYPLLWADESMTAVGAQRVLQFGYPKVHDGRNVFYDLRHSDLTLGIEPRTDAYIGGAGWLQYYFAAPFVALAQDIPDFYRKTALLRIPFATAGFAGLLLLLWVGCRVLPDTTGRLAVAVVVLLLLLPGIPLLQHLREVRYYPLQLLLTAAAFGALSLWLPNGDRRSLRSVLLIAVLVPLLFLTFAPAALAFCLTGGLFLGALWWIDHHRGEGHPVPCSRYGLPLLGLLCGGLLVVPLAIFFRTLFISRQLAGYYGFSLAGYLENLAVIAGYFTRYDILLAAVAVKLVCLAVWRRRGRPAELGPVLSLSLFLALYCLVYALCVANIPNRLFTRYFITLQPILALMFALDLALLLRLTSSQGARRFSFGRGLPALLLITALLWSYGRNQPFLAGRLAELKTPYRGVLDYVLPYLAEQFPDPSRLIIATNYEEMSYVYYLGSRVIVGFLNPDLTAQLSEGSLPSPDIVHFRRFWASARSEEIFNRLLAAESYVAVPFPVFDYGFNNIPEVVHWTPDTGWEWGLHLFETVLTDDPQLQTLLFLRASALPGGLPGSERR